MPRRDRFLSTHRRFAWALGFSLLAFIAWAALTEVDVIGISQGKLVPQSLVRISQPLEGGVVKEVLVRDGESVQAGQELVRMDPLEATEDARSAQAQSARLSLQLERLTAELATKPFIPSQGTPEQRQAALAEYNLQRQALESALAEATSALDRALAEERVSRERLTRAEQLLPLVSKQASQQQVLQAQGFVSEAASADKQKELVDIQQELAAQRQAVQSARAAIAQAEQARSRVDAEHRQRLAAEFTQAQADLAAVNAQLAKSEHRKATATLRAPVAGVINGLSTLSPGQVVPSGATLLSVVPQTDTLRFEGWLRNEDAAFVLPGMPAKVKVSAYPFQKYGWVEGEVSWVGVDSETPEAMRNAQGEPLFYRLRVDLKAQALVRNGKTFELKTGSQAVVDVELGKRSVIEYLTSPMRKVVLEAAREK